MKKPKTPNPWAKSTLVTNDWESDVVPWRNLSDKQKMKFSAKYLCEAARKARMQVFKHARDESQHRMVELLHTYQSSCRERSAREKTLKANKDQHETAPLKPRLLNPYSHDPATMDALEERRGLDEIEHRTEREAEGYLQTEIFSMMRRGEWESLRWLADYGKKHCREGLRNACRPEAKDGFPEPSKVLNTSDSSGTQLAAIILRRFAEAAGIKVEETYRKGSLRLPILGSSKPNAWKLALSNPVLEFQTEDDTRRIPVNRLVRPPQRLPSKARLRTMVLKDLEVMNGQPANDVEAEFSRWLNRLGLGGLLNKPRGVKASMSKLGAKLRRAEC